MAPSFNQFRYFCELAEVGHFGRAAERLNISQPPLSRQIALLEEELGAALFERTPKGVLLTAAGRQFWVDARDVLRRVDQAKRNATAAGRGDVGELSVGFTMCAAHSVVPILTRLYVSNFPKVRLRVREMMPNVLEKELREGGIDFGITFPGIDAPDIRARTLLHEPMAIVLPLDHPLAQDRQIRVSELASETFLIVPREQAPSLYDSIVRRCQADGFTPHIGLEVHLQQTIVSFVAEGLGIAFVPTSMQRAHVDGTLFKSVSEPPMLDQLLVWSAANKNPCIPGFLDTAKGVSTVLSMPRNTLAD